MSFKEVIIVYLIIINLVALMMYGVDKERARKGKWRIQERTLILLAMLGGSVGALVGMIFFHHKTKKVKFYFGIPLILFFQILLSYCYA